jgi:putative ABC transport system substrate-binding protein
VIAMLVNPNFQGTDSIINDMQGAARALRLELKLLNASSDHEFDTAIASATELRAGALVVASDPFFISRHDRIVTWQLSMRCPQSINFGSSPQLV